MKKSVTPIPDGGSSNNGSSSNYASQKSSEKIKQQKIQISRNQILKPNDNTGGLTVSGGPQGQVVKRKNGNGHKKRESSSRNSPTSSGPSKLANTQSRRHIH